MLMVDELSFVSSELLDRIDKHLRLAKDLPHLPFGGVHIILIGDLYQLPPPGGGQETLPLQDFTPGAICTQRLLL